MTKPNPPISAGLTVPPYPPKNAKSFQKIPAQQNNVPREYAITRARKLTLQYIHTERDSAFL